MNSETILIVEDDHVLRDGLQEILVSEGFIVLTAANGVLGLVQMEITTPDLILSDIAMPEMNGYTFIKSVRARPS